MASQAVSLGLCTQSRTVQLLWGGFAGILAILPLLAIKFAGLPVLIGLALPVVIGLLPALVVFAMRIPFPLCLGFVAFSFFRLHEAFPFLMPFKIPLLLALPPCCASSGTCLR